MLSRWRRGKNFDLAPLRIPRLHDEGSVILENLTPLSPFLMMLDGEPTVIVRLGGLPESEIADLAEATRNDRCLLAAGYKLYTTYPILIFSLLIYDSPNNPFAMEGCRDVTTADVQDFIVGLGNSGGKGRVRLYAGDPPRLVGSGTFTLRIPPYVGGVSFPSQTGRFDLMSLWLMFKIVGQQRERIPEDRLDFRAAVATHKRQEPMMSARSTFDASGVVSASDPDFLD